MYFLFYENNYESFLERKMLFLRNTFFSRKNFVGYLFFQKKNTNIFPTDIMAFRNYIKLPIMYSARNDK